MIKEEEVEVNLYNKNIPHFEKLGYFIPRYTDNRGRNSVKRGTKIIVKTEHLTPSSEIILTVVCTGCASEKPIKYKEYYMSANKVYKHYYCTNCQAIKNFKNAECIQNCGTLKRGDSYFWNFKENRIQEFHNYIKIYKSIDNMKSKDHNLHNAIIKNDKNGISSFAKECGYDLRYISKQLIDNRGDVCKSFFELYVTNFLIQQGFGDKYKKEQCPFPQKEGKFRSDITFYKENMEIHVEIWGYSSKDNTNRGIKYNQTKCKKLELYNKYSSTVKLVSIEFENLNCSFEVIQQNLHNIFKEILDYDFKITEWNQIKNYNMLTEEDVLQELLVMGNGKLPKHKDIDDSGNSSLKTYIRKNFGGLSYFSNKYGVEISSKSYYWNESKVYECFIYYFTQHSDPSVKGILNIAKEDYKLKGLIGYINYNKGLVLWMLKFANYCIENQINTNFNIKEYCANIITGTYKNRNKIMAQELLDTYFNT